MSIALEYHLQNNHYPPITLKMIPACEEAIAALRRGDGDHVVQITEHYAETALELVDNLHLHDFVRGSA